MCRPDPNKLRRELRQGQQTSRNFELVPREIFRELAAGMGSIWQKTAVITSNEYDLYCRNTGLCCHGCRPIVG